MPKKRGRPRKSAAERGIPTFTHLHPEVRKGIEKLAAQKKYSISFMVEVAVADYLHRYNGQ